MILTQTGEIGIHKGGAVYKLRPSLYAISKLGTPTEIVEIFASVHAEHFTNRGRTEQFADALAVLHACCENDDDGEAIAGTYTPRQQAFGKPWAPGVYRAGMIAAGRVVPFARSLLLHGVIGDIERGDPGPESEDSYLSEFDARDYVAMAMAHLGASETDAWRMTMTGLALALRSKYPATNKSNAPNGRRVPTSKEHDDMMAFLDKIDAMKGVSNG